MKNMFNIDSLKNTPVLVIGDFIMDRYLRGKVDRISPEAPVPVVFVNEETYALGGAGNVAANLVSLGAKVIPVGVVGDDIYGEKFLESLKSLRVDTKGVIIDKNRPTIIKTRVIAEHQQIVRFDVERPDGISEKVINQLIDNTDKITGSVKTILISDYGKGVINKGFLAKLLPLAKKRECMVTVDPKVENFTEYKGVDCITPNLKEAVEGMVSRLPKNDSEIDKLGRNILKKLSCKSVLITLGERGMKLFESSGKVTSIPTLAKEVYDVTGAGDTVIATLTLSLASGYELADAAKIANVAAGIVVGKLGTAVVTREEISRNL